MTHPANQLYHAVKRFKRTLDALELLEGKARDKGYAIRGGLYVMYRPDGTYSYQWGDAEISRSEAARRARQ